MLDEQLAGIIRDEPQSKMNLIRSQVIGDASLSRFLSGQRGIRTDIFCEVCEELGLQLCRVVDLTDHCKKTWDDLQRDIVFQAYEGKRIQAWEPVGKKLYEKAKLAARKKAKVGDGDGDYENWSIEFDSDNYELDEENYQKWIKSYDAKHLDRWESKAFAEWSDSEETRLSALDWVIFTDYSPEDDS